MTIQDRPNYAIALRILSGLLMTGMYVCVKLVSDEVPVGEVVFFRSLFAIIPLMVFLWIRNEFPHGLASKRPLDHMLRSGFGAIALFGTFASVARLNVAEAVLIAQLSPMFTAIAAVILLSERLTRWRVMGVILGFSGVAFLLLPEIDKTELNFTRVIGISLGVVSAVFSALAIIMVRSLNSTESPGAIAFYFVFVSMLLSLFTIQWGWVVPNGYTLLWLVFSGLFGGFAHIAMTLSFRYAEASRLAPFEYIAFLWVVLADLLIFSLYLSAHFFLAALLVLGGAAIAAMEPRTERG